MNHLSNSRSLNAISARSIVKIVLFTLPIHCLVLQPKLILRSPPSLKLNPRNYCCGVKTKSPCALVAGKQIGRRRTDKFSRVDSFLFSSISDAEDNFGLDSPPWIRPSLDDLWEEIASKMANIPQIFTFKQQGMVSGQSLQSQSTAELQRSIPSGQAQLPALQRLSKAVHEECIPWILTFLFPTAVSLAFQSEAPLLCSVIPEIVFLAVCSMKVLTKFDKPSYPQPLLQNRDWQYIRDSIWSSQEDVSGRRKFLMGWFYDAPFERLRREDAICILAWIRFGMMEKQLTYSEQSELLQVDLPKLEQEVNEGRKLPSRASGEEPLPCLRFNLEPLRYRHKPLIFYGVTHGIKELFTVKLTELGFRYMPPKDSKTKLGYWYRPASPKIQDSVPPTPLVFVHGVGGLTFYYQLIEQLSIETQRGCGAAMILFDLPFVSLRVSDDIPSITDQVQSVCETLDETVGKDVKSTFVGHSFGSVLLSWMVQSRPDRVANCVFLDPICFQLHLRDTLFNFHLTRVDREHQSGKDWGNPFSVGALINLAGTEMHTNNAMLRHFSWATNALWPQDLEKNGISASILLSEHDEIVPSAEIERLISNYKNEKKKIIGTDKASLEDIFGYGCRTFVRANYLPGATHGEFAFNDTHRKKVVGTVLAMMRLNNIRQKKYRENLMMGLPLWNFVNSSISRWSSNDKAKHSVSDK